eukprot:TRINITY_DN29987_c0_g1_i1.p1 TRINITY_DN29987_c0_g1~~TRINITY_DN29987_c0_g1_i1.p1  ORF type:complete len:664 (+),score=146.60 TRINITY_DN29987_c0_g1_i1:51-1994(+)
MDIHAAWYKTAKDRLREDFQQMTPGQRWKALKKRHFLNEKVKKQVEQAEVSSWELLSDLARGSASCQGGERSCEGRKKLQSQCKKFHHSCHENYQGDAAKTLLQAMQELSKSKTRVQWLPALRFIRDLMSFDLLSHGELFVLEGGLEYIVAELPDGLVAEVLPLLLAVLNANQPLPKDTTHKDIDSEDENDKDAKVEGKRQDTLSQEKPLATSTGMPVDAAKAEGDVEEFGIDTRAVQGVSEEPEEEEEEDPKIKEFANLVQLATKKLAKKKVASLLMETTLIMNGPGITNRTGLLRALCALVLDSREAAFDFLAFGTSGNYAAGGGAAAALQLTAENLKDLTLVNYCLVAAQAAINFQPQLPVDLSNVKLAAKTLISVAWTYMTSKDVRNTSLVILRAMKRANPTLEVVQDMDQHWGRQSHLFVASALGIDPADKDAISDHMRESVLVGLPRKMQHFAALLQVVLFQRTPELHALPDILTSVIKFPDDEQLCIDAIQSLMTIPDQHLPQLFASVGDDSKLIATLKGLSKRSISTELCMAMTRLISATLSAATEKALHEDYVETTSIAVCKLLALCQDWNTNTWEETLFALEAVLETQTGRGHILSSGIDEKLAEVWKVIQKRSDPYSVTIVSNHRVQTERILGILS